MKIPVSVESVAMETNDIKRFRIKHRFNEPLPEIHPGAHILTYLPSNEGVIIRPYSLTNRTTDGRYEIAIKLVQKSRGGSFRWHHSVTVGTELEISFPKNILKPELLGRHHVFYAAGIGITPFLTMLHWCKETGRSFELHYGASIKEECLFYGYLKESFKSETRFYFSRERRKERIDYYCSLQRHPIGTHVYICGPPSFIENIINAAKNLGYPRERIHFEAFRSNQIKTKTSPFKVKIEKKCVPVKEDQVLLDVLNENGLSIPYSCRVGQCGTCEITVKKGDVLHQDSFLTEKEKLSFMLPCVSRGKGLIEIDHNSLNLI
ncbi:PDR/VanB family oxidoreductase [Alteribacter aurantiacus]|uniref:PDR/VanB family oxidoreductase n=1 Tax=Alteribacter aurantiacus TaxID=254410 RepID=UPI000426E296|nr:PDR/VanB family oxidoreductase [Alteribacter aurantiacus]